MSGGEIVADTVQSIDRALSLLEILSSSKEGMGLLELGEASGLSKGTVHRLLYTLTENGYVKQLEKTGKYQLTMKMFVLGAKPVEKMDVLRVARPYLENLSLTECAQRANAVGAMATLVKGDMEGFPYKDQVEIFMGLKNSIDR